MPKGRSQKKTKSHKKNKTHSQRGGAVGAVLDLGSPRVGGLAVVTTQGDCPQINAENQYGGKRKTKK